ncbi:MAG: FAD/NAD(P)-binding protein [Acidimicrobiia bacterium]|jgi:NAD(P)H-flavin reductase
MSTQLSVKPDAHVMSPAPCRIIGVERELQDTYTLEIEPPGDDWSFLPGQYTMLYAFGIGEVPISISGDPGDSTRIVQTIRAVGAVSDALVGLQPGDSVGVRGPFGTAWDTAAAEGRDVLIVAGGVGLAPLRPVVFDVLNHRDRYENVTLMYGARSPADLLFATQISEWRSRFDLEVLVTVDHGDEAWRGPVGVVTSLINRSSFDGDTAVAFVCGPEVMMRFTIQALERKGLSDDRLYVSMERNMKCGIGLCGHCQLGKYFLCKDGPVMTCAQMAGSCWIREV